MAKIVARIMWYSKARPKPVELEGALSDLDPLIVEDSIGRGCWWTSRQCWLSGIASDCTHILVLADDAVPCLHFSKTLELALETRPDSIISLCSCKADVQRWAKVAYDSGRNWIDQSIGWVSGVALLMPKGIAKELVAWADANIAESCYNDEAVTVLFAAATERLIAVANPSLIEHDTTRRATFAGQRPIAAGAIGDLRTDLQRAYQWAGNNPPAEWKTDGYRWDTSPLVVVSAHQRFLRADSPLRLQYQIPWAL
jgi:hypothetical protein